MYFAVGKTWGAGFHPASSGFFFRRQRLLSALYFLKTELGVRVGERAFLV